MELTVSWRSADVEDSGPHRPVNSTQLFGFANVRQEPTIHVFDLRRLVMPEKHAVPCSFELDEVVVAPVVAVEKQPSFRIDMVPAAQLQIENEQGLRVEPTLLENGRFGPHKLPVRER